MVDGVTSVVWPELRQPRVDAYEHWTGVYPGAKGSEELGDIQRILLSTNCFAAEFCKGRE